MFLPKYLLFKILTVMTEITELLQLLIYGEDFFQNQGYQYFIKRQNIAKLKLSSGEILACDPYGDISVKSSFKNYKVPRGDYNVELFISYKSTKTILNSTNYISESEDIRVAAACVYFSNKKPITFEIATKKDENVDILRDGEYFGYGVDSGLGCFMDKDAAYLYDEKYGFYPEEFYDRIDLKFQNLEEGLVRWVDFDFNENNNLVAFSTGYGDGIYASYWGIDERDHPVCLITLFDVL
jgi:hypothetical protein